VVDCYERVGYRGTTGTIRQTDGTHIAANTVSMGLGSSCLNPGNPSEICSKGVYELVYGTFQPRSVDCGIQGRGEFDMSGGTYFGIGGFNAGMAYAYSTAIGTSDRIAGHCEFNLSGNASFTSYESFNVGHGRDVRNPAAPRQATGVVTISDTASFFAHSLWAGGGIVLDRPSGDLLERGGNGSIVQEGGDVDVGFFIVLGANPGGVGTYTIRGGSLSQTGTGSLPAAQSWLSLYRGMYVGLDYELVAGELALVQGEILHGEAVTSEGGGHDSGHGELIIEGGESTIDIEGFYRQGSDSRLTVKLSDDTPRITPIQVNGIATFEAGSELRVELLPGAETPEENEVFTLLVADTIAGEPELIDPEHLWFSDIVEGEGQDLLIVAYTPNPACGLTGLEPFLIYGMVWLSRRRSGARVANA
jgi:hypothetical protein